MKTVYSDRVKNHRPAKEIFCGEILDCAEKPSRAESVYEAVRDSGLGPILPPQIFPLEKITRVHRPDYIEFLQTAHADWAKAGFAGDAFATNFNMERRCAKVPKTIEGKMGFYLADTSVSLSEGTWDAVEASASIALTALDCVLSGDRAAFALTRPPGHHASTAIGAGYGFLNNAAIAVEEAAGRGCGRVAILDVDYHHGNGTQDIFYARSDVLYCSLHADPAMDFPYFLGYADETGEGEGAGYNVNYPLPLGTDWSSYGPALRDALTRIDQYGPDLVVVSLGLDTFKDDPISKFRLDTPDYARMGEAIAALNRPTLFVLEGGYAIAELGRNVVSVLGGFSGR